MRQNDKIACISENRERRDRKNLCKAISDFQQSFQSPETRREFDLSDPLALKKDRPARQSDYDAWNTISGMQKFMGEDLNFHLRKKFQEEQNREWSLQQQKERMVGRENHKCAGNRTRDKWVSVLYQINPPKNKQTKKENKPTRGVHPCTNPPSASSAQRIQPMSPWLHLPHVTSPSTPLL